MEYFQIFACRFLFPLLSIFRNEAMVKVTSSRCLKILHVAEMCCTGDFGVAQPSNPCQDSSYVPEGAALRGFG